jgi:hypothetical protein
MSNEDERGRGDNTTPTESHSDSYNGWANRETWAVALHINNDQGWQESVREAVREYFVNDEGTPSHENTANAQQAGEIVRENVEDTLDLLWEVHSDELRNILTDLGSLWRVDWTELGASFLEDLEDDDA